jgi:hypothetical protein
MWAIGGTVVAEVRLSQMTLSNNQANRHIMGLLAQI